MKELTSKQRKFLSSEGHHLDPVVMLGQKGVTPALIDTLIKALDDHELVKLRFIDYKGERKALAFDLAEKSDSLLVRVIGNTALFYRMQKDDEKRKIILPKS